MAFLQIAFVIAMSLAGIATSFWARRANLQGIEIWLPLSIIVGLAYGHWIGFAVAFIIMVGAWALFPYRLDTLFFMGISVWVMLFGLSFFAVNAGNFVFMAIMATLIFNIVTNVIFAFLGNNPGTLVKFFAFSMGISWLVYDRIGWQIVMFLKGG